MNRRTHVVETTYRQVAHDGTVIKDWTVKTKCGREFARNTTTIDGTEPLCRVCERKP